MVAVPVRCRLDDAVAGTALEARGYQGSVEARSISDVVPVLAEVEAATRKGRVAVGLVAYEAAPAFDAALTIATPEPSLTVPLPSAAAAVPLVWFGLFDALAPAQLVNRDVTPTPHDHAWDWQTDRDRFAADVHSVHEQIADGMTYQVNLTTRLRRRIGDIDAAAAGMATYRQLVHAQCGAYNAYVETPEWIVASGSPELFFSLSGGTLTSKPMKGTARRGNSESEDEAIAAGLVVSPKERAENVMIVDLMRNDLGRVAQVGTVAVRDLFALERYRTVWQMTSTVTCEVRPGVGLVPLFEALFPAGSVTGAPKPSTMAIISSLERSVRGPYCGAIGYVAGGEMRFGVGIRTAVLDRRNEVVEFGVGSGITWYANADDEWAELAAKATVLGAGSLYSEVSRPPP